MKLEAQELVFGYRERDVLARVSLEVREGELLGLVGPNGAGKSTLLRCLAGECRPRTGRVLLEGRDLGEFSRRELARRIGVVPQSCTPAFPVRVTDFVGMGRFAHERFLGGSGASDRAIVQRCLDELGLAPLAERAIDELSGGEFRRVLVAQALAQEPAILLFDEPVQQLDLAHVLEVMEFAQSFARGAGRSGVVVLHDLGLAARYCDRLALLVEGRLEVVGPPASVLQPGIVGSAYGVRVAIETSPASGALQVVPLATRARKPERDGEGSG